MPAKDDATEILQVLRAYHSAMVDARTDDLSTILERDFSLVHLTGYAQPRAEWFDVIQSGEFDYHHIDVDDESVSVNVFGKTATATGKGIFDATIEGMRRPWRLEFAVRFDKSGNVWRIAQARYTTF